MNLVYMQDQFSIYQSKLFDNEMKSEDIIYEKSWFISSDGWLLSNLGGEVITFCFLTSGEKFEFGYYKID